MRSKIGFYAILSGLLLFLSIAGNVVHPAMADDKGNVSDISPYQWVLWKVVQNPQGAVGFPKDAYRTKKSCKTHIPRKTSIYEEEGPKKRGYVCLPRGLKPFYSLSLRNENHIPAHPEQSSPSGN